MRVGEAGVAEARDRQIAMTEPKRRVQERRAKTWAAEDPTDAEVLAAFSSLIANSGRYTWTGNEFTTEASVVLNPNYMASWGENHVTYRFSVDGDTLTVTWPDDFGAGAGGAVGTFRRVGTS